MITKSPAIDQLIDKLLAKFNAQGSNINRTPSPYLKEALKVLETAPFLAINDYLYFLSEMSVFILELEEGSYLTVYGVDNWDEGLNILDYPIPDEQGFHLVLDILKPDGELLYFSYHAAHLKIDKLWISRGSEGPTSYSPTDLSFMDILNLIYNKSYLSYFDNK